MSTEHKQLSRRDFIHTVTAASAGLLIAEKFPWLFPLKPESTIQHKEFLFSPEPEFVLDFSTLEDGAIPEEMCRIQDGIDDDWNPEWNTEVQMYTNRTDNVRVQNGKLILQAHVEKMDGQEYTSGKIDTKGIFQFQYGKVEVRAKFPKGRGVFPALWFLPDSSDPLVTQDENDPFYWQQWGEIDLAEMIGINAATLYSTLHTYDTLSNETEHGGEIDVSDISEEFHTFGLEKTPGKIVFTLDGIPYFSLVRDPNNTDPAFWPFDENEWYFIANLAMGGNWADEVAEEQELSPIDDESEASWKLEVESMKYYPLAA